MMPPLTPLRERLLSRLIIDTETGCLDWAGALHGSGYADIRVGGGKTKKVHRVMYEMFVEPIPEGLDLDHLCRNRGCGSPAHLEPVTRRVNTLRGEAPSAVNVTKTHCPADHEYDLLNTRWNGRKRYCRACDNARHRLSRAQRAAS